MKFNEITKKVIINEVSVPFFMPQEVNSMDLLNGLTLEEAVKSGKLIPINLKDPTWVEKYKPFFNDTRPPLLNTKSASKD